MTNRGRRTKLLFLGAMLGVAVLSWFAPAPRERSVLKALDSQHQLVKVGKLEHPSLREASGFVASKRHPGVFWAINDSGNEPQLFAVDRTGATRAVYNVHGAPNIDWEALALDDEGNLYVGDVGNNVIRLKRRFVYVVPEPKELQPPNKDHPLPELTATRKHPYVFPDKPLDVEGMFYRQGSLYLVSKVYDNHPTHLYRLPLDQPGKDVKLEQICSLQDVSGVTDASLSADGKKLALCSYAFVAIFQLKPDEDLKELAKQLPLNIRFSPTEIEGCGWDGDEFLLVSENRLIYGLKSR